MINNTKSNALNIYINDKQIPVKVPDEILHGAKDFFAKMDSDMSKGWQMSRTWIEKPNKIQRCQIAADKILSAIHTENQNLLFMMVGYILNTMPGVEDIIVDGNGEMMETELVMSDGTRYSDTI